MDPLHPDLAHLHQRHLRHVAAEHRLAAALRSRPAPTGTPRRAVLARLLPLLAPRRLHGLPASP